ncbi:hypothetical protein PoB_005077400 [Plakobranchus ocellatus]|uniref:Uncharacterized protein n=1 Tax=Plakobranchus ocellatus TaxID=259542 RepID=A0AAV4C0Q7_9GAST|nr:hypothetical protein PoB_005077400 [Plakobranchus ocellatus]
MLNVADGHIAQQAGQSCQFGPEPRSKLDPAEHKVVAVLSVVSGLTSKRLEKAGVHNNVISGFGPCVRPGRRWRGSDPRQKGPCRYQGGIASHRATDAPIIVKSSPNE